VLFPASAAQAKSPQPKLSSVSATGLSITVKGSAKLPAKKSLHGKKLTVKVSVLPATGKAITKSASLKAKRKAATVKFKVSLKTKVAGTFKVSAQLYLGKKKLGKASKSKSLNVIAPAGPTGDPTAPGVPVSVGGGSSCTAIGGKLKCWGAGPEVGAGSNDPSPTATTTLNDLGVTAFRFSVGAVNSCALVNGYAKCWGQGYYGGIGNGTSGSGSDSNVPVQVTGITGGGTSISVGNVHACAVNNAKVQCWGQNQYGQLGRGSTSPVGSEPQDISAPPGFGTPYKVAAGSTFTCANTSSGIWCWGNNGAGQLGVDPASTPTGYSNVPVHVGGVLAGITYITEFDLSVGNDHACAQMGGHAYCWGSNIYGQLGSSAVPTGGASHSWQPVSPDVLPIDRVATISAGFFVTCAISTGTARCWGQNDQGQVGNGTIGPPVTTPTQVVGFASGASSISAGWYHTCGSQGTVVKCWGASGGGWYLGDGVDYPSGTGTPVTVKGL
jgi:serine/threonine-protein kinase